MSQPNYGFVLIALNTDVDYNRLAYACALSIKHSQPGERNHVTVFTNNTQSFEKYQVRGAIDSVEQYYGPLGMDSRSRVYELTPYEHTIFLDCDMLILDPIDWNMLTDYYLYVASTALDFKGNAVVGYGPYRKLFEQNQLPNLYNAFTYFKKSDPRTKEFFELVTTITDSPRTFVAQFLPNSTLLSIPTDEAFAIATMMLDIENEITDDRFKIIHMKPLIQGWPEIDRWTTQINLTISNTGRAHIGVWAQQGLLHYVDKTAIDNTLLTTLEELTCQKI